jgi:hypothetical protein
MSILTTVGATAVSGFWKLGAIAALVIAAGFGGGWVLAAHDRNVARADLVKERKVSADLTAAVHEQNIAVAGLAAATADAVTRREAAQKAVAGAIARSTTRAAAVSTSTAQDCAGVLNEAWEGWK